MKSTGEIIIYQTENNLTEIEVRLEEETVWLTQEQMAVLFQKNRTVITRHINNIFKDGELGEKGNVQKMHFTNSDKPTKIFNLDVIISVGYRVKSKRGIQFRVWANKVIKDYLLRGYALNEKLLKSKNDKLEQLNNTIKLISSLSIKDYVDNDSKDAFLILLEKYSSALNILDDYDNNIIHDIQSTTIEAYILEYNEIRAIIEKMKITFGDSKYFGKEKDDSLKSSISTIYQTFDGKDLYSSIIEKAVNLLYFIVKNHSFIDGNKRIAAAVFLYFLDKNQYLNKTNLDNNLLVALTLMIANSSPTDKDLIINIISVILQNKENNLDISC